ncbi:thioesterase domain-containing protein [Lentzea sp. DG1S-22]|uniref:thioesterase II family protein n=1 Tax=Lentzea sp. DG1S-22 TaxID=3108822 RepID=UPI002E7A7D56|nr:thioesterase domain-containing protein [Lentzea sp. DG1S-22]WVH82772.1 thioesterase domain-containing protein [Lentzea sp. DG1S-22]
MQSSGTPDVRVVCFPHSGGSARSFAAWAEYVPPHTELVGVQYPGRGDRFAEAPAHDVRQMAAGIATELLRGDTGKLVFFGHSLGALVAYETAVMLRDAGAPPQLLMVSGSPAPHRAGGGTTHQLDDEALWATVCALGGVEPAVADDPELRDILLPTLRADIRASELYAPKAVTPALSCPIRCYHGVGDPLVDRAELGQWSAYTTARFSVRSRDGAHFHVWVDPAELVADVLEDTRPAGHATASPSAKVTRIETAYARRRRTEVTDRG